MSLLSHSDIMELKRMMEKLGQAKTHLELKKMIAEVDKNNSGLPHSPPPPPPPPRMQITYGNLKYVWWQVLVPFVVKHRHYKRGSLLCHTPSLVLCNSIYALTK